MTTTDSSSFLEIHFEGYFTSRIATDPDPTNEERGMSGYTMALAGEDRLDQIIRLQVDEEYMRKNARPPLGNGAMGIDIGVTVREVTFRGAPWRAAAGLLGAPVTLEGRDAPLGGPIFESRNNITGSDDTMAFVIDPFKLRITGNNGGRELLLAADDYLDPSDPAKPIWLIDNPEVYARRLTRCWKENDIEVAQAIGVFDAYGYFRDRRRYLEKLIADAESAKENTASPAAVAGYRSRIHQLEFWGDRIISKIGTRCDWQFDINGPKSASGALGGQVDTAVDWPIRFWFGGWDGDLLTGYLRGTLCLPFQPGS